MRIEACDFGTITIDGRTFTRDLKIVGGRVVPNWWRVEGHVLLPADIEDILAASPEVLVVGTGMPGMMSVSREVRRLLAERGIELVVKPTREACDAFNNIVDTRGTAFAAHLTC